MAIIRTVLPRKAIILPRHGDSYEADLDANFQTIDNLLQDAADVQGAVMAAGTVEAWLQDCGLSGVVSGFELSTSANLTPGLAAGALYAQGMRYAPASAPNPGAAPASSAAYLFYNRITGFYYNLTGSPAVCGDAYLGSVTTDTTHVTAVLSATKLYGMIQVNAGSPGSLSVVHNLGRAPAGALIYPTSPGAIWFQSPTMFDATRLYLIASDAGVIAKVQIW